MTSIFSGRLFKLVYIVILILILLLVGCADSQNGGESSNITEDSDSLNTKKVVLGPELIDIVGTYQLEAFTILDETNNVSVDESDLESWCG